MTFSDVPSKVSRYNRQIKHLQCKIFKTTVEIKRIKGLETAFASGKNTFVTTVHGSRR